MNITITTVYIIIRKISRVRAKAKYRPLLSGYTLSAILLFPIPLHINISRVVFRDLNFIVFFKRWMRRAEQLFLHQSTHCNLCEHRCTEKLLGQLLYNRLSCKREKKNQTCLVGNWIFSPQLLTSICGV